MNKATKKVTKFKTRYLVPTSNNMPKLANGASIEYVFLVIVPDGQETSQKIREEEEKRAHRLLAASGKNPPRAMLVCLVKQTVANQFDNEVELVCSILQDVLSVVYESFYNIKKIPLCVGKKSD